MSQPPAPNAKRVLWEGHAFQPFSQPKILSDNIHFTQSKEVQQQRQQYEVPNTIKPSIHTRQNHTLNQLTSGIIETYSRLNSAFYYSPSLNPRRALTKPVERVYNQGYDNREHNYILHVHDIIASPRNRYRVVDLLGQGSFGQVVKCLDEASGEYVAMKIIKSLPAYHNQGLVEVKILQLINSHFDADRYPMVRLLDHFVFRNHLCLVFELLSISLYDLIRQNQFKGLSLKLIVLFVRQLLVALEALAELQVMHCDLKPENVLLEDISSPNLKLIDFGSACFEFQAVYSYIQSRFYRSPEVILGLPYRLPIDIWSLGCVSFELFVGLPLFPGQNEHRMLARIIKAFGMPPYHMLAEGRQTHKFFNKVANEGKVTDYELKSDWLYSQENNLLTIPPNREYFKSDKMEEIIMSYEYKPGLAPEEIEAERYQRRMFIHVLQGMLRWDPDLRWTPSQTLRHPFFTGAPWSPDFEPPPDRALSPSPPLPYVRYTLPTQQSSTATNSPSTSIQPSTSHSARRNSRSDADDNYRQHRYKTRRPIAHQHHHHHRAGGGVSSAILSSSPSTSLSTTSTSSMPTTASATTKVNSSLRQRSGSQERSSSSSTKPRPPSITSQVATVSASSSTLTQGPYPTVGVTKGISKGPPRHKRPTTQQSDGRRRRSNSSPPLTPTEPLSSTAVTQSAAMDHILPHLPSHPRHSYPPKHPFHSHSQYHYVPKSQLLPSAISSNTQYLSKSWEAKSVWSYSRPSQSQSAPKGIVVQNTPSDRELNLLPLPTSSDDSMKSPGHTKDSGEDELNNDGDDGSMLPHLPPLSEETTQSSSPPPTELITSGREQELDELLPWPLEGNGTEPSPRDLTATSDPSPRESHGSSSLDSHDWDPTYSDDQLLLMTPAVTSGSSNTSAELMTMFSPPEREGDTDLNRTLTQLTIHDTDALVPKYSGRPLLRAKGSTQYSTMLTTSHYGSGNAGGYMGPPLTTTMTAGGLYSTSYPASSFLGASPYEYSLYSYVPSLPQHHLPHPHHHHHPTLSSRTRVPFDQQTSLYSIGFGGSTANARVYNSSHLSSTLPPSSSLTLSRSPRNTLQYSQPSNNTKTVPGTPRHCPQQYQLQPQPSSQTQQQQQRQTVQISSQQKSSSIPPQTS
jgi:serine/threonine protein kinase